MKMDYRNNISNNKK